MQLNMCMLAVCIGKQKLVQVLTCSTCMTAVASGSAGANRLATSQTPPKKSNGWLAKRVAGIYVTADLSVSR